MQNERQQLLPLRLPRSQDWVNVTINKTYPHVLQRRLKLLYKTVYTPGLHQAADIRGFLKSLTYASDERAHYGVAKTVQDVRQGLEFSFDERIVLGYQSVAILLLHIKALDYILLANNLASPDEVFFAPDELNFLLTSVSANYNQICSELVAGTHPDESLLKKMRYLNRLTEQLQQLYLQLVDIHG